MASDSASVMIGRKNFFFSHLQSEVQSEYSIIKLHLPFSRD